MIALIFIALFSIAAADQCVPRDFGDGSVVCVCNSTYCDSTPETILKPGTFHWYVSSKSGRRMDLKIGTISKDLKAARTITINPKKQFQQLHGFGGAFTDSAGLNIKNLSDASQKRLLNTYFSKEGSRYNIGRLPIGGSDFSTRFYTYDDFPNDNLLSNFSLAFEDLNFKIPLMQKALEINPELKFLAVAWTAPTWMKTNNDFAGYGFLKKEYYQTYTDYLLRFMDDYKKHGLEMWALSTGNEPSNAFIPLSNISTTGWTSSDVATWVAENLGPSLAYSQHNKTIIIAVDDHRTVFPWYVDVIFRNQVAKNYISGIGVHWYWDAIVPPCVLDTTHNRHPDKFILMTEACEGSSKTQHPKVRLGYWKRAETHVEKIIENLQHWSTGWIDWNMALDKTGGPTWINNNVDSPIIVNPETDEFFKQPMYYAIHHFSRFLPRGSVRIESIDNSLSLHPIFSIAFQTPQKETVVVIYNRSRNTKQIDIKDPTKGNINLELSPRSINTIVYSS